MSAPSPRSVLPLQWEKRLPPKGEYPSRTRDTPQREFAAQNYNYFFIYANISAFCGKNRVSPQSKPSKCNCR